MAALTLNEYLTHHISLSLNNYDYTIKKGKGETREAGKDVRGDKARSIIINNNLRGKRDNNHFYRNCGWK